MNAFYFRAQLDTTKKFYGINEPFQALEGMYDGPFLHFQAESYHDLIAGGNRYWEAIAITILDVHASKVKVNGGLVARLPPNKKLLKITLSRRSENTFWKLGYQLHSSLIIRFNKL